MTYRSEEILDGKMLWVGLGAAVALMVTGAASERMTLSYTGGALFLATVVVVGGRVWHASRMVDDREAFALTFARLLAAVWAWCGLAMLASYYLTDLSWQHAWQYGAAMLLIGGGILAYAQRRELPGSPFSEPQAVTAMRWATGIQGLAALGGVALLLMSGKVETQGRDWAANIIFIAGGIAIFTLSAMAVLGELRKRS